MYIYIYIYIYVNIYVHIYRAFGFDTIHKSQGYGSMGITLKEFSVLIERYLHFYIYVYSFMYAYIYIHIYVCKYTHIHMYININTYIYIYRCLKKKGGRPGRGYLFLRDKNTKETIDWVLKRAGENTFTPNTEKVCRYIYMNIYIYIHIYVYI
jgi:hypothetical protein